MASQQYEQQGIELCPDGHRCENGSMCAEDPIDEGNYFCDCDEVDTSATYAGLFCEHKATVYCISTSNISKKSFCTNAGACKAIVGKHDVHMGCECVSGYEGSHCQFVAGTKRPEQNVVAFSSSKAQNQLTGGGIFLIVVLLYLFVGVVFVMRRGLKKKTKKEIEVASMDRNTMPTNYNGEDDLTLEVDGSAIKDEMIFGSSLPLSENKQSDFDTIMDDQAEII